MAKKRRDRSKQAASQPSARSQWVWLAAVVAVLVVAGLLWTLASRGDRDSAAPSAAAPPAAPSAPVTPPTILPPPASSNQPQPSPASGKEENMEVAKAVMVTVELDFGGKPPSIAEAIKQIERRYAPADGAGRTFAILDAYGEPTPDGKLHMSMHVSSEKAGTGSLVFRRTGEVLWSARITSNGSPLPQKSLVIYIKDDRGNDFIIDGSNNPASILDAKVRDRGIAVRDFWPEGAEREVTFVYSACGCPVKVMARRLGNRTVRTKDTPVIFPDDPGAVVTINKLMGW